MAEARETEDEEVVETAETEQETETEEVATEETVDETETEEETEAEAEAETETEEVEEEPPAKPISRAQRRIQALSEAVHELRKRVDAPPQRQPDPNAEAEARRREAEEDERVRLSGDPDLIARHAVGKVERKLSAQFSSVVSHVVDRSDKTDFQALCASNPAVAAVADAVEKQLVQSRAQGLNPTREALAKYILGERLLNRAKGAKTRQQRHADTEVRRQAARPGSSRSDVSSSGRRKKDSHEERAKRLDESGML